MFFPGVMLFCNGDLAFSGGALAAEEIEPDIRVDLVGAKGDCWVLFFAESTIEQDWVTLL